MLSQELKAVGMLNDAEMESMEAEVKAKLKTAMTYSENSPTPDPAELETDVYAPSIFTVKDVKMK